MKKLKGIVRWFDCKKGEGVIRVNNECVYVHYSAIDRGLINKMPNNKWNKEFYYRVLFPNQKVNVSIIRDSHFTQIESVW